MHYSFPLVITPSNTVTSPAEVEMKLGAGKVRHVRIFFQAGCANVIRAIVRDGGAQVLPTNQNGYYSLENNVVEANYYRDMSVEDNTLYLTAWTVGSSYNHYLECHIEVQGLDEYDMVQLYSKLLDTIDRLAMVIRSIF